MTILGCFGGTTIYGNTHISQCVINDVWIGYSWIAALARTCFFCSIASLSLGKKGTGQIGAQAQLLSSWLSFETFQNASVSQVFLFFAEWCVRLCHGKQKHHGQWEQGTWSMDSSNFMKRPCNCRLIELPLLHTVPLYPVFKTRVKYKSDLHQPIINSTFLPEESQYVSFKRRMKNSSLLNA